jgi:hypothetical protein
VEEAGTSSLEQSSSFELHWVDSPTAYWSSELLFKLNNVAYVPVEASQRLFVKNM